MTRGKKLIAVVLTLVCVFTLCACDVKIDVNINPKATPSQTAQATNEPSTEKPDLSPEPKPSEESTPSLLPEASQKPVDVPSSGIWTSAFPFIEDEKVLKELCAELSVEESVSSPAIFSEVYAVDAIAYRCDGGKFYVRYDDQLNRIASFYLKNDEIDGHPVRTASAYGSGWMLFTQTVSIADVPGYCEFIPGHEKPKKANLLYILNGQGGIEHAYAVPYTEKMEGQYLFAPKAIGDLVCVYVDYEESILLNPGTGKIVDIEGYTPSQFVMMNDEILLYEESVTDDKRQILLLNSTGKKLDRTTVPNGLSIRKTSDGSIYMTGDTKEKDIIIDDRSDPVYFFNDAYEFKKIINKNEIYDRVIDALEKSVAGDIRYHIYSLNVIALSEKQYQVLCGVDVFDGDEILYTNSYVLVNIEI